MLCPQHPATTPPRPDRPVAGPAPPQAIRSFPNMSAEVLVDSALAAQPREAWAALLAAMRRPHSAVLFHTLGRYVLVQGIVGGAEFGPSCALFICSSGHGAPEFVSFAEALATMRRRPALPSTAWGPPRVDRGSTSDRSRFDARFTSV